MMVVRKAEERGHFDHGWLDTYHSFSFADYYDPAWMGFRSLRVMNDDRVAPGQGFGMHPHRDMEIITYVLEGELEHADSLGSGSVIKAGELQRMSAGSGIRHSEFNPARAAWVHLYQIWLLPNRIGVKPGYEQRNFDTSRSPGRLWLVASPDGADDSLRIHQDARVYLAALQPGQAIAHELAPQRAAWVQVLRGKATLGSQALAAGDGAALTDEGRILLAAQDDSEIMLFDLP